MTLEYYLFFFLSWSFSQPNSVDIPDQFFFSFPPRPGLHSFSRKSSAARRLIPSFAPPRRSSRWTCPPTNSVRNELARSSRPVVAVRRTTSVECLFFEFRSSATVIVTTPLSGNTLCTAAAQLLLNGYFRSDRDSSSSDRTHNNKRAPPPRPRTAVYVPRCR